MTDDPVTPDQELLDEKLLESLVQFDEALRAGRVPTNPVSTMTDGAYVDLTTAANCLLELEGAYPRSRGHRQHSDSLGVPRRVRRFAICSGAEPNTLFRAGSSGIEVWDAGLNQQQATLVRDHSLNSCSYDAEQRMLVVGDSAGRVGLMQPDQPNGTNWFDVFSDSFIICATAYDEGKHIVALSGGDELAVLDVASRNVVARLPNRSSFAVSPDARWLATARHGTNDLLVLEAGTLQEVARLAGHQRPIRQIKFSRDGKKMLMASDDRTAIMWDTNSWSPTYSLLGNSGGISSVAISPDGETIVTGEKNGTSGLWYGASGQKLFDLTQLEHDVMSLEFAANGDALFALASDMSVHVFSAPRIGSPESATASAEHFPPGERH